MVLREKVLVPLTFLVQIYRKTTFCLLCISSYHYSEKRQMSELLIANHCSVSHLTKEGCLVSEQLLGSVCNHGDHSIGLPCREIKFLPYLAVTGKDRLSEKLGSCRSSKESELSVLTENFKAVTCFTLTLSFGKV